MAILINQRTVGRFDGLTVGRLGSSPSGRLTVSPLRRLTVKRGSITFWAWMVSIAVHLIVLTAFGFIKFSQRQAGARQRPVPTAKVSQIKKLTQATPIIPKPKIKKLAKDEFTRRADRLLPANQTFSTAKPSAQDWLNPAKPSASTSALLLLSSANLPK